MSASTTTALRIAPLAFAALLGLSLLLSDPSTEPASAPPGAHVVDDDPIATVTGLAHAAQSLAEERGRAYVALHAAASVDGFERGALHAGRADAEARLDAGLGRLAAVFGAGHPVVDRLRVTRRQVDALRAEVDGAIAPGRALRDARLARRWFQASTALIEGLHHGAVFAGLRWSGDTPVRRTLVAMQRQAWRVSDLAGRQRALIGAAIASGAPVTAAERNVLAMYDGRLVTDWRRLERSAGDARFAAALGGDLARVRRALFGDLASARVSVLDASERGAAYPFTPAQWFSLATRSIDTVAELRRNAARSAREPPPPPTVRARVPPRAPAQIAGHA